MACLRKITACSAFVAYSVFESSITMPVRAEEEDEDEVDKEDATEDSPPRPAHWQNTVLTTDLWKFVSKEDASRTEEGLETFLFKNPKIATARSEDGRGGIWWAWEYKNAHALAALKAYDADPLTAEGDMKDAKGYLPKEMCKTEDEEMDGLDEETKSEKSKKMPQECKDLLNDVESTVKAIKDRKKEKEEEEAKQLDIEDDEDDIPAESDDDDDDDASSAKAKKKKVDVNPDEDDL